MSNITHGMNPEEVEDLGRRLKDVAGQIQTIVGDLERSVGSTTWVGQDATTFKTQWWPQHKSHLTQVSQDLDGFGQSAINNATEQRQASGG